MINMLAGKGTHTHPGVIVRKPKQKILKPMPNSARIRAYARDNHQTGRFAATPAQRRRINKHAHREDIY